MPLLALIIVLIAALLHAISNLFFKSGRNSSAFLWWAITIGALWYGVLVAVQSSLAMRQEAWLIIIPSIVVEIAYARLITLGYENGDLSQVYPIARGTPPLLIALFGAIFIGERLPFLGYVGIVVLVIGIYLASVPSFNDVFKPLRAITHRPTQIAFLAALCVTAYTLLDKVGMQYASPLVYNWWMYTGIAIGYAPIAWSHGHRAATLIEWRTNWRRIVLGSFATIGSYLAALIGLQMTAASYVGSVRASSVVIGALLGWLLLKEPFGAARVFAAALMVVGLLLIALA